MRSPPNRHQKPRELGSRNFLARAVVRSGWPKSCCAPRASATSNTFRVQGTQGVERSLASDEADLGGHFAAPVILRLQAGDPIVMLGGEHIGCFELLGSERIRTIRDLKG